MSDVLVLVNQPAVIQVAVSQTQAISVTLATGQGPAGPEGPLPPDPVSDPLAYYILAKS